MYKRQAFLSTSRQKLLYYARHTAAAYHPVTIPKRNGDVRILSVPDDTLRRWQRKICRDLLAYLPVAPQATAYRKGGTLSGNAAPHVGKRYLLKLDISDFFGSICFEQVHSAAFHTRYFSRQVGFLLTSLCCKDGALPQGAPTSPALSNLVMRNFDTSMARWCQRRGIVYTRYCDDLTFSADRPLFAVYSKAKNMLAEMGFDLNEAKTHFITNAGRQSVTGLTVNEKVSVSAGYKRSLRQEVYYALRFGLADSILRGGHAALRTDGVPDTERYRQQLLGRVQYVLQIEPENRWFREAKQKLLSCDDLPKV